MIEVPTCMVMAGGIDARGVGFITGGGITRVNPEGVSLVPSALDLCIVLRQRFQWPDWFIDDSIELSSEQLDHLLDGYNLNGMRPHRSLTFIHSA